MAGSSFTLTGSRLASATFSGGVPNWQAAEDADVTSWSVGDDFIFAAMVETTSHGGASGTLELRWRNVTDSGTFAGLSGSGELNWSAATDLVNANAVTSGEAGCTPSSGTTYTNGVEREGANGVSTTLSQNEYTEHHWAIDASAALGNKQYEFEIYDVTAGASLGTCLAQITFSLGSVTGTLSETLDNFYVDHKHKLTLFSIPYTEKPALGDIFEIDYQNEITRGVRNCLPFIDVGAKVNGGDLCVDIVNPRYNAIYTFDSHPAPYKEKWAGVFDGLGDVVELGGTNAENYIGSEVTFMIVAAIDTDSGNFDLWDMLFSQTNTQFSQGYGLYHNTTGPVLSFYLDDYQTNFVSVDLPTDKLFHTYVCTWNGNDMRIFMDGVSGTTDTYAGPVSGVNTIAGVMGRPGSGTWAMPGACALFYRSDIALTDYEARELSLNPWQIFKPKEYKLTIPTADGLVSTAAGNNVGSRLLNSLALNRMRLVG